MRIVVAAVGKVKERGLREAIDEYAKRIGRHARFEEVEIKDGPDVEVAARFRRATPDRSRVVALEVQGVAWSSERLAELVRSAENGGVSAIVFLIGGAYGLPAEISREADVRLSLSAMTLPHRIARLVLVEQIYRAYTIVRGEPYSH